MFAGFQEDKCKINGQYFCKRSRNKALQGTLTPQSGNEKGAGFLPFTGVSTLLLSFCYKKQELFIIGKRCLV